MALCLLSLTPHPVNASCHLSPRCRRCVCFIPKHQAPDLVQPHRLSGWDGCRPLISPHSWHSANSHLNNNSRSTRFYILRFSITWGSCPNWKPTGSISRFGHYTGLTNFIPAKPWNQSYIHVPLRTWETGALLTACGKQLFLKKLNSHLHMNQSFHS